MFEGNFESLAVAVVGVIRLLALGFVVFLIGVGASVVDRIALRITIVLGSTLLLISGTYFSLTHRCAGGYADTDDYGRPFYTCTEWVQRRAPYGEEQSLAVGAVALLAVGGVMMWWQLDKSHRALAAIETRLNVADQNEKDEDDELDAG